MRKRTDQPARANLIPSISVSQWAAVAFLAALVFFTLLLRFYQRHRSLGGPFPMPAIIHVQGDVKRPGVHLIERIEGRPVTLAEALKHAGGLHCGALSQIPPGLLRQTIESGRAVHAICQPDGGIGIDIRPMEAAARLVLGEKIDINEATEEELCLVPHMKPSFASAIVERRRQKRWRSLHELKEIHGIGARTVEKWKDTLEVRE